MFVSESVKQALKMQLNFKVINQARPLHWNPGCKKVEKGCNVYLNEGPIKGNFTLNAVNPTHTI